MKERAYAKINLCLDVAGKRDDGFHDLKMIMCPVDFYDVLEMTPAVSTSLTLNRSYLPTDEKNTIVRAIEAMRKRYGFSFGFACDLTKHIPTRAGLGGGSADGAAAVRLINSLLRLHMTTSELIEVGAEVGSDVPFCVINRPALVSGRGEVIEPFYVNTDLTVLLVKPRKGVSTRMAFALMDKMARLEHPDCQAMKEALAGNDYEGVVKHLGNVMEKAAEKVAPEVGMIKERLLTMGFDGALMSGSGSTVFGLTLDRRLAEEAMETLKRDGYFVRLTRILRR